MSPDRKKRFRNRRKKFQYPTLSSQLPNIITIIALAVGMSSMRCALMGEWQYAVLFVFVAGILDTLDGRLARLLGSSSRFGAELDSLSDFINFGVSPAFIMYLWVMKQWGGFGWTICLIFSICMSLRLARFNTRSIEGTNPTWAQGFFLGVPAPAAAFLSLLPLITYQEWGETFTYSPWFTSIWMVTISALMVSSIPTFSLKKLQISPRAVLPLLLLVGGAAAFLVTAPWLTLVVIEVLYIIAIPFSVKAAYRAQEYYSKLPEEHPAS